MTDPDVVEETIEEGVCFQLVRTTPALRAEFPWLRDFIWGAWIEGGNKLAMVTGASKAIALAKLRGV